MFHKIGLASMAATASVMMRYTVNAKSEKPSVTVTGFAGRAETRSVLNYLKWRGIAYSTVSLNPLKSDLGIDHLPLVTIEGNIEVIGAPESISIFESKLHFDASMTWSDVIDRYPKTKVYTHDENGAVLSRDEIMNKFNVQYPDYADKARTELNKDEQQQARVAAARRVIFDQIRTCMAYYEHQTFFGSIACAWSLADNEDWPIHEQCLFALAYGIAMWRQVRQMQAELIEKHEATNLWIKDHGRAVDIEIAAGLAQLAKLKSKDKFLGGSEPSIADVELFTQFELLSPKARETVLETLCTETMRKWHLRMAKKF